MFHKIYIFQVGFPPDLNHVADHFDNKYNCWDSQSLGIAFNLKVLFPRKENCHDDIKINPSVKSKDYGTGDVYCYKCLDSLQHDFIMVLSVDL